MSRQLSNGIVVATSSTNVAVSASAVNADAIFGTASGSGYALHGTNTGTTGKALVVAQTNTANPNEAVNIVNSGTGLGAYGIYSESAGGNGISAVTRVTSSTPDTAGVYGSDWQSSSSTGDGVKGLVAGSGSAIHGAVTRTGATGKAGFFEQAVAANAADAVTVTQAGTGKALNVTTSLGSNASDVVSVTGSGTGAALHVTNTGGKSIYVQQTSASNVNNALDISNACTNIAANGINVDALGGNGISATTHVVSSNPDTAGVYGFDSGSSSCTGDGVKGSVHGSGTAIHGYVSLTGATGKVGWFEQATPANTADAVTISQAGAGKGLNVVNSLATNTADGITIAQGGIGKGLNVSTTVTTNAADAATISQGGTGKGLNVSNTLATNSADVLTLAHSGIGKAASLSTSLSTNSSDTLSVTHGGTGKVLNLSATLATNSSDALVVAHAGTGKGLNVNTSLSTNASATALFTQSGTGKILDLSGTVAGAVGNGITLAMAGITGHGLSVNLSNSGGATGDAVLAQNSGTGVALHGKANGTGKALHAEGPATISGTLTAAAINASGVVAAAAGATLVNGKSASSVVMFGAPARFIPGLSVAASTWTYYGIEGTLTSYGIASSIPHDAVAVFGTFAAIPTASVAVNTYWVAIPGSNSGGLSVVTFTGNFPGGTASAVSGGVFPVGNITSGTYTGQKGFYIWSQVAMTLYFDCYGYMTT